MNTEDSKHINRFEAAAGSLDSFLDGKAKELKEYNDRKEEIISSTAYMDWLSNFTLNHPHFTDYDFLYAKELIGATNASNVSALCILYEILEEYAIKNFISPLPSDDYGTELGYAIEYVGQYYIISSSDFQGGYHTCCRSNVDPGNSIPFENLMNDTIMNISAHLKELTDVVNRLKGKGFSKDTILEEINKAFASDN